MFCPTLFGTCMKTNLDLLSNEWAAKTAERLRTLRVEQGLSHQKLSDNIKQKCGVSISADSLSNYEVTYTENHSRSNKTKGMKIEFLRAIADYFGVSTDYLLAISDIPSDNPDMRSAVEFTGLSQNAIDTIRSSQGVQGSVYQTKVLNWLLSNPRFTISMIFKIVEYLSLNQGYIAAKNTRESELSRLAELTGLDVAKEVQIRSSGKFELTFSEFDISEKEDSKDLALFRLTRHFDEIIRELSDSFCKQDAVYSKSEEIL